MFNLINFKQLTTVSLIGFLMATNIGTNSAISQDNSPEGISFTGTIRDFKADHPDFEFNLDGADKPWNHGMNRDRNIVTKTIGSDKKPVYNGAPTTPSTSGEANFNQWFNDVPGVNKSIEHSIYLEKQSDGTYQFSSDKFFPINDKLFGNIKDDPSIIAPDNHKNWGTRKHYNYHFTYEVHQRFTYKGGETFSFRGDDDVWVYINGKRVIDIGGVHGPQEASVKLDDVANELGIEVGGTYDFDFFFAERNFSGSNFKITTSIELEEKDPSVSLELVLAVDVSTSVSDEEYAQQIDGYIAAFNDPEVQDAIKALPKGMAVNMQFWGAKPERGRNESRVADTGWYKLSANENDDNIDGLSDFINVISSPNTTRSNERSHSLISVNGESYRINGGTDIQIAIEEAASLLLKNEYKGDRLVIDVSGDGIPKNTPYPEAEPTWEYGYLTKKCGYTLDCPPVVEARDAAIRSGITINGLPINGTPTPAKNDNWEVMPGINQLEDRIDKYYRTQVVGGTNSFSILADGFEDFKRAVKLKVLNEIKPVPTCNPLDGCSRPNIAPDAQDDAYEVLLKTENILNVTINDSDADGDSLTITDFDIASDSGTLNIVDNQLVYTAPDTAGEYTFMYKVDDGKGGIDKAEVKVKVYGFAD